MTTILNLYGGPGTGKSTSAAFLYYALKQQGCNAELVREYVKDWAWQNRAIGTYDQFYILGQQVRRESVLYGKVEWAITDCPVMLSAYYSRLYCPPAIADAVKAAVSGFYAQAAADGHRHVHLFLKRTKPYLSHGRYQDESAARAVDAGVRSMLDDMELPVIDCGTEELALRELLEIVRHIP